MGWGGVGGTKNVIDKQWCAPIYFLMAAALSYEVQYMLCEMNITS